MIGFETPAAYVPKRVVLGQTLVYLASAQLFANDCIMRLTAFTFFVAAGLTCAASVHGDETWHFGTGMLKMRTPPANGRLENGFPLPADSSTAASDLNPFYVDLKSDNEGIPVHKICRKSSTKSWLNDLSLAKETHRPPLLSKLIYAAAFQTPKGRIIVSATSTINSDCQSYERVGLSSEIDTCPMKIALINGDGYKIIYSTDKYPFAVTTDANGAPIAGANENTLLTYNVDSKQLTTSLSSGDLFASRDTSRIGPLE